MNDYPINFSYGTIDDYIVPEGDWDNCPRCNLRPKVWEFDNGRFTACGCWKSKYDHFSVKAETIMSVYRRTNGIVEYDFDALRKNWNHWCRNGEMLWAS